MKRQKKLRIPLYENRSVSQCVEAVFDFMRTCRSVWLRLVLLLFLPSGALLAFSVFVNADNSSTDIDHMGVFSALDFLFSGDDQSSLLFLLFFYIGVWMVFVHVYSLLEAYRSNEGQIDDFSLSAMKPYLIDVARRSWWLPALLMVMVFVCMLHGVLFVIGLVVLVPMALFPSVWLFERDMIVPSISKAFFLGWRAWWQLAFVIFLTTAIGLMVTTVLDVPILLGNMFFSTLFSQESTGFMSILLTLLLYVFNTLSYVALFICLSMVIMGCAYEYGTVSDRIDAASVDADIAAFEDL